MQRKLKDKDEEEQVAAQAAKNARLAAAKKVVCSGCERCMTCANASIIS